MARFFELFLCALAPEREEKQEDSSGEGPEANQEDRDDRRGHHQPHANPKDPHDLLVEGRLDRVLHFPLDLGLKAAGQGRGQVRLDLTFDEGPEAVLGDLRQDLGHDAFDQLGQLLG